MVIFEKRGNLQIFHYFVNNFVVTDFCLKFRGGTRPNAFLKQTRAMILNRHGDFAAQCTARGEFQLKAPRRKKTSGRPQMRRLLLS